MIEDVLARTMPSATPVEGLGRRVAVLGSRLAALLQRVSPAAEDALTFLRLMAESGPPSGAAPVREPLKQLAEALGLCPLEVDLVVLAGMPEEHEGYASVLRGLNPRGEPWPTAGLAAQLLCPGIEERGALRRMLISGPLVRSGAVSLTGEAPFFERNLQLAEALWDTLLGLDAWPTKTPVAQGAPARGLEDWLRSPTTAAALAALAGQVPCTVLLTGSGGDGALGQALALVEAARRRPLPLMLSDTPASTLALHCLVREGVPVLQPSRAGETRPVELHDFATYPGPLVVCSEAGEVALAEGRPVLLLTAEVPGPGASRRLWKEHLPELAEAMSLSTPGPATVQEVAGDVRLLQRLTGRPISPEDLTRALRARTTAALPPGVQLRNPTAGWEHLVLPEEKRTQLREAMERLRHQETVLEDWRFLRGRPGARGVRMLFSGPPGTGKTLSAEVLAHALGFELLVVDLSRLVSKWLGETEKNLSAVFDAAERGHTVLLFDEADALFGKRTEVSDAHDRYANLETAYLLMRLERFDGMAILSTNLKDHIDRAFLRRLEFVLEFEEPGAQEREQLWRVHLPERAPLAPDVDLRGLAAHYGMSGGLIRNAAVAAAFLAAGQSSAITREHLVRAIRREYDKAGRAFPGVPPEPAGRRPP